MFYTYESIYPQYHIIASHKEIMHFICSQKFHQKEGQEPAT